MSESSASGEVSLSRVELLRVGLEDMVHTGVGVVDIMDTAIAVAIASQLNEDNFVQNDSFWATVGRQEYPFVTREMLAKDIQRRQAISSGGLAQNTNKRREVMHESILPDELWVVRQDVRAAFDELALSYPEYALWSNWANNVGVSMAASNEIVRYPPGVNVAMHTDDDSGVYPSQALLTIYGEGNMYIELDDHARGTIVLKEVELKPGRVVLLRGSEQSGTLQPPHAVVNHSERVLYSIGADRVDYVRDLVAGNIPESKH